MQPPQRTPIVSIPLDLDLDEPPDDPSVEIAYAQTIVTVLIDGDWPLLHEACYLVPEEPTDPNAFDQLSTLDVLYGVVATSATTRALRALQEHIGRHFQDYAQFGLSLVVSPLPLTRNHDDQHCMWGAVEPFEPEMPSFTERLRMLEQAVRRKRQYVDDNSLPPNVYAPTDAFFSAVDDQTTVTPATWERIESEPGCFALVDLAVLIIDGVLIDCTQDLKRHSRKRGPQRVESA